MTHKSRKKLKNFMFWSVGYSLFFCFNFFQFLVIKALDLDWIRIRIGSGSGSVLDPDRYWIRIRIGISIQPKMLDPDPDEMNADPQPCYFYFWKVHPCRTAQVMTELMSKAPSANYIARQRKLATKQENFFWICKGQLCIKRRLFLKNWHFLKDYRLLFFRYEVSHIIQKSWYALIQVLE